MGDDNAADEQSDAAESVDQPQCVEVVGDTEIAAPLVLFDVVCRYDDDNFGTVGKLTQHLYLAVRLKSRKNAGGVVIVEKLASEFEIQFPSERIDSFENFF